MSTRVEVLKRMRLVGAVAVPSQFKRLLFEVEGQDMVEYALLTTFIGFVGFAAWSAMQAGLGNAYQSFNRAVWDLWEPADPVGAGS